MMWMLFLYYLASDVTKNCLGWPIRAQNQRTEPQTATQKLQWFSGPQPRSTSVCLYNSCILCAWVWVCWYVLCLLITNTGQISYIQDTSVGITASTTDVFHVWNTVHYCVNVFTFIYSCECCCLWVRAVENAFNLWKSLHLNCKCNCWHRFSLLCASYSVATQYIINVL